MDGNLRRSTEEMVAGPVGFGCFNCLMNSFSLVYTCSWQRASAGEILPPETAARLDWTWMHRGCGIMDEEYDRAGPRRLSVVAVRWYKESRWGMYTADTEKLL